MTRRPARGRAGGPSPAPAAVRGCSRARVGLAEGARGPSGGLLVGGGAGSGARRRPPCGPLWATNRTGGAHRGGPRGRGTMESGQDRPGRPRAGRPARRIPLRASLSSGGAPSTISTPRPRPCRPDRRTRGALQGGPLPVPGGPDPQGHVLGRRPCPAPTAMRVRASPAPGGRGRTIGADLDADRVEADHRVEGHPEAGAATSGTAPAHRVGDLRDRPPAPGPAPMVDPPVWWRISRAHSIPGAPGVVIQSSPARPVLLRPMAPPGAALSEPARTPGHHWSRRGPPGELMVLGRGPRPRALAAGRGRRLPLLHGPGCSAGSARRPRPRNLLGAERGAAPGPRSSRACPESIRSNRPSRAPVSRNRRATSRPSTGPFPSSAALNRRQSLHQGSHKPLNTPPYAHG